MQIVFDREKTQIVKGVAIATMIIHHCIERPSGNDFMDLFGSAMKICVSYFTFLVGFGYAFSDKSHLQGLKRVIKLLSQYWLLLFPLFIPLCKVNNYGGVCVWGGGGHLSIYQIIMNSFGIQHHFHPFSWYIYFYIYAMLIMPLVSRHIDKYGKCGLGIAIMISYILENIIHLIPWWKDNIFTQALFDCMLLSPILFIGYYLSANNVYGKINVLRWNIFFLSFLLACPLLLDIFIIQSVAGFSLHFFYVPIIVLAIVAIFSKYRLTIIRKILVKMGDFSMQMWFIHALFIMPFTQFAFISRWTDGNSWLKFLVILPASFMLSIIYSFITKPIVKRL